MLIFVIIFYIAFDSHIIWINCVMVVFLYEWCSLKDELFLHSYDSFDVCNKRTDLNFLTYHVVHSFCSRVESMWVNIHRFFLHSVSDVKYKDINFILCKPLFHLNNFTNSWYITTNVSDVYRVLHHFVTSAKPELQLLKKLDGNILFYWKNCCLFFSFFFGRYQSILLTVIYIKTSLMNFSLRMCDIWYTSAFISISKPHCHKWVIFPYLLHGMSSHT